ncbi:winged helix-turn-helix domain-containing protein [Providencia sp. PROV197]|uniref:winged helix-turn-helix domain-containing protein n=1 Tax=Providencia sp. PROV197 TaxID=2949898 RepID=UPI00234A3688|nr:hypothetical protein [Providencia sp. PROV197]
MKPHIKYIINDKFEFDYTNKKITYLTNGSNKKLLTPAANILLFLIKNKVDGNNDIISQDDLFNIGWGEKRNFVTISTFYQNILLLRKAFIELEKDFDLIKNIPKVGYKLVDDINIINTSLNNLQNIKFKSKFKSYKNHEIKKEKNHIPETRNLEVKKNIDIPTPDKDIKKNRMKWLVFSRLEIKKIITILVLIIIIMIILFNYINYKRGNDIFTYYTNCGEIDSKKIFCNTQLGLEDNLSKVISEEVIAKSFNDYSYLYIMRRNFTNKVSVIYCKNELGLFSLKKNKCVSYYIID